MATSPPLVSIVILNWNGLEDTKVCLEHVRQLDYPNYEIIVVDNGSRSDQKRYLGSVPDIIYVDNPVNRGFTGGHIDGLRHASGDFILLLNNDAVIKSDFLKRAMAMFKDPDVAVVGGRSYHWNDDTPLLDERGSFYAYHEIDVFTSETRVLQSDFGTVQEVNNISGSAAVVRRSAIDRVGYLYEPFFAYFEETDLFARMKRAGYKILYNPRLQIWHRNGGSSGSTEGSYFFYYQIFRNRFIFAVRNFEAGFLLRFLCIYVCIGLGSLVRLIVRPHVNRNMHRAYAKATAVNLLKLPALLYNRRTLTKQLGPSQYNHQIYKEQVGISVVLDCSGMSAGRLQALSRRLAHDQDPLHEYILVIQDKTKASSNLTSNQRFVLDRRYFGPKSSLNLGCIAARHAWLLISDTGITGTDVESYHWQIAATLGTKKEVAAFNSHRLAITKAYYQYIGGFVSAALTEAIAYAARYASIEKKLSTSVDYHVMSMPHDVRSSILADRRRNMQYAQSSKRNLWRKLTHRYYRLAQTTVLVEWLFATSVPVRLKLARIKNLVLFSLALNRRSLALELKHIRNENTIYRQSFGENKQRVVARAIQKLSKDMSQVPVFIICFERVDSLRTLVAWLQGSGFKKIIFIDNDSTYKPLLDYYQTTPYQVLRLYRNVGHRAPWSLDIIRILLPRDFYIVTDPDVIPAETCPNHAVQRLLDIHRRFPAYQKVGFGLKIDDLPRHYPLRDKVIEWEGQFWEHELAPHVYEAGVDTTFALYKPYTYTYTLHPSIRTGEPYVARHLPWYVDPKETTTEERYYRARASANITSWNVDTLPDRYQKELRKQAAS